MNCWLSALRSTCLNRTPGAAEKIIAEEQPQRPSAVVQRVHASSWADLDVLCLTAMHKDPQRRYRTVDALIRDVDHYLKGEPLEARPDTLRYRAGKFVRRNRRAVIASTLGLAAVLGIGGATLRCWLPSPATQRKPPRHGCSGYNNSC